MIHSGRLSHLALELDAGEAEPNQMQVPTPTEMAVDVVLSASSRVWDKQTGKKEKKHIGFYNVI